MLLKARYYDVDSGEPRVIIHDGSCSLAGLKEGDRAVLKGKGSFVAIISRSDTESGCDEILMPVSIAAAIGVKEGDPVDVLPVSASRSMVYVREKMGGAKLTREEIASIVRDIDDSVLSPAEVASWITTLYIRGMDMEETADLTASMAESGLHINFSRTSVFDFHSIGGVPGNKITPIVVSIVAAAGLMLPKLSSRAISSACGTVDFVEVFCRTDLNAECFREVVESTGGSFAMGSSIGIAPAGDIAIKVQYPLGIDPRSQMLASIMSKKVAIGATHLLIDIPAGPEAKAHTIEEARKYVDEFIELGRLLNIHVECAVTSADQPIGMAIGPALEARECIRVLEGDKGYGSVVDKACTMAGVILEMSGIMHGATEAKRILESGEALAKFREIVSAQGGNPNIVSEDIVPGKFTKTIYSDCSGYVNSISNKALVAVARAAGSPTNKGAGLLVMKRKGQRVEKGDVLLEIYADSNVKCDNAYDIALNRKPISVEGMLLERATCSNNARI